MVTQTGWVRRDFTMPAAAAAPVAAITAVGWLGAVGVGITGLIRGHALAGSMLLLVPALVVLGLGLFFVLGDSQARRANAPDARQTSLRALWSQGRETNTQRQFGALPVALRRAVYAACAVSVALAISAMIGLGHGTPETGTGTCPYELRDHKVVTCVPLNRYEAAFAAEQQLFAGILSAMFALQSGLMLNSRALRRQPLSR